MTQLKTLNNFIEEHSNDCYNCEGFNNSITTDFADKIKKEAINWIKTLEQADDLPSNWNCKGKRKKREELGVDDFWDGDDMCHQSIIDWIKHFFNITNEDLK